MKNSLKERLLLPTTTLPQSYQDKLNNIVSYKDSNYLYTIVDKTNILPEYVRENLKPTLHATFKGGGWYARFKTEQGLNQTNKSVDSLKNETIPALKDGLLNSSEKEAVRQSLNVVSADKKGIDTQFTTVYANIALTGTAKTNLNSAKVALNTAFTNLQVAISAVLGVGDGTRITTAQMTLVTTRLNEYGTALSTYNQRYEQAQDAISTEKKRLAEAYALAQANLAETQAKAHADGKITAEEKRAIQDAKDKLAEAKKYVDALEIGGRNLLMGSGEPVSNEAYNIARYNLTEAPKDGEIMTLTLWGELASTKTQWAIYNSGGNIRLSYLTDLGNGVYQATFSWTSSLTGGTTADNSYVNVYAFTNAQTGTSTINKIKLERGNITTDWTEAPEDTQSKLDEKLGELVTVEKNNEELGKITTSLNDYLALVEQTQEAVNGLVDEDGNPLLAEEGEPIQGGVVGEIDKLFDRAVGIENDLKDFTESWNFDVTQITMGEEGMFVGTNDSNMGILIAPDRVVGGKTIPAGIYFQDGGQTIAFISGQMMQINRGIFVQSAQIGEHQIETIAGGHTIFSWIPK